MTWGDDSREWPANRQCPECRDGKHRNCTHVADYDVDDTPIECTCGCLESRTCPSCGDVVPSGRTLDDHLNCNWPDEHDTIRRDR